MGDSRIAADGLPAVVSKDRLVQSLAGWDKDITPNAIEVHVSRLRHKLATGTIVIRTVRGIGYRSMPLKTDPAQQRHPLSLRQRLILALLTPLIVILTVSSYFDYRLAKKTANNAHDQSLADNVFDLEAHIKTQDPSFKLDLTEEGEAMLRSNAPDMLYFSVSDPFGKVVAGDTDLPQLRPPKDDQVEFANSVYHDMRVRVALHRITINAQDFLIVVMETTKKREQASARILTAMVIPNLAVILATMLAVVLGVRQGLLPLNEVEHDIAERSASDLHEIDLSGKPAEIRPMLRRLNELFALLRESVEVQQRFIADAAHQLRTPLAGLQTQLDLANSEGAFNNNPERIQLIEEATLRISHLLSQLLAYARAETSSSVKDKFESRPRSTGRKLGVDLSGWRAGQKYRPRLRHPAGQNGGILVDAAGGAIQSDR
jgi:two-component system sensor histidine kinase TctE